MSYGMAIDPGVSSGICLFSWGGFDLETGGMDDGSFKQERVWQFPGGADAIRIFLDYLDMRRVPEPRGGDSLWITLDGKHIRLSKLVVEKFTPRPHESFGLTQKTVEPLRGEGVLIGRNLEEFITWREPSQQYFMGGADLPEKKKRSREFLKLNGLYVTGSMVGSKDADDAISAELHAIGWLRALRHMPTLVALFEEEDK